MVYADDDKLEEDKDDESYKEEEDEDEDSDEDEDDESYNKEEEEEDSDNHEDNESSDEDDESWEEGEPQRLLLMHVSGQASCDRSIYLVGMNGDTTPPHMPSELVLEIVAWLPVKSLLRFRCVCKAWRDTISDDAAFHRAHLRAQPPRLLISTCTEEDRMNKVTTIGFPNGVSLAPTEGLYSVFHQLFGIGYDLRGDTYKVARFFFRPKEPAPTGGYHHNFGMEVYTIGVDEHWRETVEKPPYAVDITGTSAFSRGSLFWTIDHTEPVGGESPSGFLRFRLEDESFSVTPPPPCCEGLVYEMSYLSELHGELSVAHPGPNYSMVEKLGVD
uniref:Uncharacterized protein n=1 Tax=Aegilops tauschii TaxID=37682 RepID=M8C4H9_AEGTA